MKLSELKEIFDEITILKDAEFERLGFLGIENSSKELVFLKNEEFVVKIGNNVTAILTTEKIAKKIMKLGEIGIVLCENPEKMYYMIHNYLAKNTSFYKGSKIKSSISLAANIGEGVYIAPYNVIIGDNTIIEPQAVILENVKIGNNCFIGANTVVGTRGFQYFSREEKPLYVEHIGGVIIEDYVDVLSNVCVAQGLMSPTIIGSYSKIDNFVHVAHSVQIGKEVLVTAGVILGGSTVVGDRGWIGVNASICPGKKIDNNAYICMGAVVTRDIAEGEKVSGNFAIEHSKQIKFIKSIS